MNIMDIEIITAILAGVTGAMLGSFLNVCICRLPEGESIVAPRSHCPGCGGLIRWYDNLPVLSYIFLLGRCRHCRERISIQYPLVEAACAGAVIASWLRNGPGFAAVSDSVFLLLLIGIAITDAQKYIIPDGFSLVGLLAGLCFSFFPGGITPGWSLVGLIAGGGSLYLVALAGEQVFGREAMGGGDVKMMAMVGAFTGWQGVLFTVFVGSLAGSLIFGWLNFVMKKDLLVPFGVFLSIGGAVYIFFGPWLIEWYLVFFGF